MIRSMSDYGSYYKNEINNNNFDSSKTTSRHQSGGVKMPGWLSPRFLRQSNSFHGNGYRDNGEHENVGQMPKTSVSMDFQVQQPKPKKTGFMRRIMKLIFSPTTRQESKERAYSLTKEREEELLQKFSKYQKKFQASQTRTEMGDNTPIGTPKGFGSRNTGSRRSLDKNWKAYRRSTSETTNSTSSSSGRSLGVHMKLIRTTSGGYKQSSCDTEPLKRKLYSGDSRKVENSPLKGCLIIREEAETSASSKNITDADNYSDIDVDIWVQHPNRAVTSKDSYERRLQEEVDSGFAFTQNSSSEGSTGSSSSDNDDDPVVKSNTDLALSAEGSNLRKKSLSSSDPLKLKECGLLLPAEAEKPMHRRVQSERKRRRVHWHASVEANVAEKTDKSSKKYSVHW